MNNIRPFMKPISVWLHVCCVFFFWSIAAICDDATKSWLKWMFSKWNFSISRGLFSVATCHPIVIFYHRRYHVVRACPSLVMKKDVWLFVWLPNTKRKPNSILHINWLREMDCVLIRNVEHLSTMLSSLQLDTICGSYWLL